MMTTYIPVLQQSFDHWVVMYRTLLSLQNQIKGYVDTVAEIKQEIIDKMEIPQNTVSHLSEHCHKTKLNMKIPLKLSLKVPNKNCSR